MVLPEDEIKIYNETLKIRLEATNQQLKKWINRWRPVIDHNMKTVKEMTQSKSIPIGVFRLDAAFHGTLATQLFDSNNMRDGSRQENYFENY